MKTIILLLSCVVLFSTTVFRVSADSQSVSNSSIESTGITQNAISGWNCLLTKWLINWNGLLDLNLYSRYMGNISLACETNTFTTDISIETLQDNSMPPQLISIPQTTSLSYPWCDTPDIVLGNGQIWAACNVGATKAGTGVESYGSFFQWGRNLPFASTGSVKIITWPLTLAEANSTDAIIVGRNDQDWLISHNSNLWGWEETSTTGAYQTQSIQNQILMQGPCANGYHVPTYEEWKNMVDFFGNWINFILTMKVPLTGWRMTVSDGAPIVEQWSRGSFLLSSSTTPYSIVYPRAITFNDWFVNPNNYTGSKSGISVRCIKN